MPTEKNATSRARCAAVSAAVLGCCAACDSVEPFDVLAKRYEIGSQLAPMLRNAAQLGDVLIILAFGAVLCVFHPSTPGAEVPLSEAGWFLVMVGLGVGLGLLFRPFLGGDESDNARFLALVGIIIFASGAAYFLELASLTVNLLLGIVLVHFARGGKLLHLTLERTERPMRLVLLVFAGALWEPPALWPTVYGLGAFLLLRWVGKWLASVLASLGTGLRRDIYRGLMSHGEVTVAMAVSFRLFYSGAAVDIAYTVILGSVVFWDLFAPRMLRTILVEEGDLLRELPPSNGAAQEPA